MKIDMPCKIHSFYDKIVVFTLILYSPAEPGYTLQTV